MVVSTLPEKDANRLCEMQPNEFFSPENVDFFHDVIFPKISFLDEMLVDFSGESPLLQMLRLNHQFRSFETLFLWSRVARYKASTKDNISSFLYSPTPDSSLTLRMTSNADLRGYVFAGPAFVSDDYFQWNSLNESNFIGGFHSFAAKFLSTGLLDRMKRFSALRSVITTSDSDFRFEKIQDLLSRLATVSMPAGKFSRSILRVLLRAVITAVDTNKNSEDLLRFSFPLRQSEFNSEIQYLNKSLDLRRVEGEHGLEWESALTSSVEATNDIASRPDQKMSELSDRAHTNATDQRLENLLVYRNLIFSEVNSSDPFLPTTDQKDKEGNLGKRKVFQKDGSIETVTCDWLRKILRCDVVTFFRSDHSHYSLEGTAFSCVDAESEVWARKQIDAIADLSKSSEQSGSYLYKSFSNSKQQLLLSGQDFTSTDAEGDSDKTALGKNVSNDFLSDRKLRTPKCALILPVQHGGRTYGVIECVSFLPFAFDSSALVLIDEFTDLLGQFFLVKSNAKLVSDINEETVGKVSDQGPQKSYDQIARIIANYFLCFSASIWRPNNYNANVIELRGQHNRFNKQDSIAPHMLPKFNLSSIPSVTQQAFEAKKCITGQLGQKPFDTEWLEADFRKDWVESGAKYAAVLPIFVDDQPVASIALASKNHEFTDAWAPQFEFCADVVGSALKNVAVLEKVVWDGLSDTSHELGNISNKLNVASSRLKGTIGSLEPRLRYSEPRSGDLIQKVQLSLGDVLRSSEELAVIADVLEPESFVKFFGEGLVRSSPLTYRLLSKLKLEEISIREIWNEQFENASKQAHKKALEFDVRWLADQDVCYVDQKMTASVLRNLIANAIKYAPKKGKIDVEAHTIPERKVLTLKIANLGPRLSRQEQNRIFERRFRGFEAEKSTVKGLGEGLFQAKAFAKRQKASLSHIQDTVEGNDSLARHQFTLTFPLIKEAENVGEM